MTKSEVQLHLRYAGWAAARLLEAAAALPLGEAAKDRRVAHHSIEATLAHWFQADRIWLARVTGGPRKTMNSPEDEPYDLAMLRKAWPEVQAGWLSWAESVEDYDARYSYQNLKGDAFETPLGQIVMHVVNHGAIHAGQVTAMLRQAGAVPPAIDLIAFYRTI